MMVEKKLSEEERKTLLENSWYHQRFDGCSLFLFYVGVGEVTSEERKMPGGNAKVRICFFTDHKADWYLWEDDNERITKIFLEKSKTDYDFTEKLMERWEDDEKKFYELCEKIEKTDLNNLKNEELKKLYDEIYATFIRKISSSSLIDGFALYGDRIIADKLLEYLKEVGRESEYNRIFSVLTAPVHLSFTNEAELSLLKIAIEDPKNIDAVKEHQKRYFWLHNNYVDDNVLTWEFFEGELLKILDRGNAKKEYERIKNHPSENKKRKEKLMDELKLPYELRSLIKYSEDFTHWQDERKKSTFFTTHYFSLFLEEIGKRFGFTVEELKYLVPPEIKLVFEGKINKEELRKRIGNMGVIMRENKVTVIIGEDKEELFHEFVKLDIPADIKVIKGMCASLGKAKGKVKVVKSARDIGKVEEGNILVAVMTRPDYVIGMKKAAAIVTDEGGITCHAAIVSRELKIPCIIGTRIGSRVLKDGDSVEVDADNGEVRIV